MSRSVGRKTRNLRSPSGRVFDGVRHAANGVTLLVTVSLVIHQRLIADFDGVSAAGDFDDRGGTNFGLEMFRKPRGVNGGTGDDEPQVGTLGKERWEAAEEEVDIEGPLVGFVDDDGVVLVEGPVGLRFRQQHAVGHHFDQRLLDSLVGKADFVADQLVAVSGPSSSARRSGDRPSRNSPRLGVADKPADAAAEFQADFGICVDLPLPVSPQMTTT